MERMFYSKALVSSKLPCSFRVRVGATVGESGAACSGRGMGVRCTVRGGTSASVGRAKNSTSVMGDSQLRGEPCKKILEPLHKDRVCINAAEERASSLVKFCEMSGAADRLCYIMKLLPGPSAHRHGDIFLTAHVLDPKQTAALLLLLLALIMVLLGTVLATCFRPFASDSGLRRCLQGLHLTYVFAHLVQCSMVLPSSYDLAASLGYGARMSGFIIGSAYLANAAAAVLQIKLLTQPWIQQRSRWVIVLSAFGSAMLHLLFTSAVFATWSRQLRLAVILIARGGLGFLCTFAPTWLLAIKFTPQEDPRLQLPALDECLHS